MHICKAWSHRNHHELPRYCSLPVPILKVFGFFFSSVPVRSSLENGVEHTRAAYKLGGVRCLCAGNGGGYFIIFFRTGEWETLQNIIREGEGGGNLPGCLAGNVVEPKLFFTVRVPVPTSGKVFLRGEWEILQNIILEGAGGIFQSILQAVLWNRNYFLLFRFVLGGRCLCAGNGKPCRTSSGRGRGESSRPSCRQCCGTLTIFYGSGFGSGSY